MIKKVTIKWLEQVHACSDSIDWFKEQKTNKPIDLLNLLIKKKRYGWCNWGISRLLNRKNKIRYALYAAKQILPIFENKYPDDKRPRQAIEAAEEYLKNPSEENKEKCNAAADAARAAAAYAAADAAYAAYAADAEKMYLKIIKYGIKLLKNEQVSFPVSKEERNGLIL